MKIAPQYLAVSLFILFLTGCVTPTKRLSTNLNSKDFNSLVSQYLDRPTFVEINGTPPNHVLFVKMDPYGADSKFMIFSAKNKSESIQAIDKFLKWEAQARKNKDILEKEIARVKCSSTGMKIQFSFYSGTEYNHFLSIGYTSLFGMMDQPMLTFDRTNAIILKKLLIDLDNFDTTPVENLYN